MEMTLTDYIAFLTHLIKLHFYGNDTKRLYSIFSNLTYIDILLWIRDENWAVLGQQGTVFSRPNHAGLCSSSGHVVPGLGWLRVSPARP